MNLLPLFPPLAAVLVFSLVVSSAGLLLCTAVRRLGPATQHSLLRLTLILLGIGALFAPFAGRFAPEWVRRPASDPVATAVVMPTSGLESLSGPTTGGTPIEAPPQRRASAHRTSSAPTAPLDLRPAAVTLWLAGSGLALILLLGGSLALHRIRRGSATLSLAGDLTERIRPLFPALRIRLLSAEISPFQAGLLKPCIYLPQSLLDGEPQDLQVALLHEASHAARQDCAWRGFGLALRGLLWPNPVVWLLVRRLCWTAEAACDDAVVAQMSDQESYSRSLLHLAERFGAAGRQSLAPGILGYTTTPPSLLRRRVERLLSPRYPTSQKENRMSPLISRLCAGSLLLCAAAGIYGASAVNPMPVRHAAASRPLATPTPTNSGAAIMTLVLRDSTATASALKGDSGLIRDSDVNRVLEELWHAGVGTATVQGKRVKRTSTVRAQGPDLILDGTKLHVPVTIASRGDSTKLKSLIGDPKSHLHMLMAQKPAMATLTLFAPDSKPNAVPPLPKANGDVEISSVEPVLPADRGDEEQARRIRELEEQNRALTARIRQLEATLSKQGNSDEAARVRELLARAQADQDRQLKDRDAALALLEKARHDTARAQDRQADALAKQQDAARALLKMQQDKTRKQKQKSKRVAADHDAAIALLEMVRSNEAKNEDLRAYQRAQQQYLKQLETRLDAANALTDQASSKNAAAQADYYRLRQLFDKGYTSQSELTKSQALLKQLQDEKADLQRQRDALLAELKALKDKKGP